MKDNPDRPRGPLSRALRNKHDAATVPGIGRCIGPLGAKSPHTFQSRGLAINARLSDATRSLPAVSGDLSHMFVQERIVDATSGV